MNKIITKPIGNVRAISCLSSFTPSVVNQKIRVQVLNISEFSLYHLNIQKLFYTTVTKNFRGITSQQNMDSTINVCHDDANGEFYIKLDEGPAKAVLQYQIIDGGKIDMYHTGTPVEFRGKGVAKVLAKAAMDYAVEKDLKVILTCTYLQKYVKDNPLPKYTERVVVS